MTATEIAIARLGWAGDGIADGGGVVPETLPGDRVRLGEGGAQILEPSPHRVAPPCPHAGVCGGCLLQHADLEFLAAWKRERLIDALARVGIETEVAPTIAAPPDSRRRVKLAGARTKSRIVLGFHARRAHRIELIETCRVARPEIVAALPALAELVALAAPRKRPVALWVAVSEGGLDVAVEAAKPLDLDVTTRAAAWAETADVARLAWNGEMLAARRPAWRRMGRALVEPPPAAFEQATAEGAAALVAEARRALEGAARVADLFAGAGTFALPLAEGAEVFAAESDAGAVAALERGWRAAPGLKRVEAVRRDLFRRPLSPEELAAFDGVLFDPPRVGAEAQARALAEAPARLRAIVGVSCDPTSFARDAAILREGGWRLERVTPVDQFLWTAHLELIGVFRRATA